MQIKLLGRMEDGSIDGQAYQGSPVPGMPLEEFAALAASIVVIVPHRPTEGVSASISMNVGLWALWGINYGIIEDQFAGEIAAVRGNIVKGFLQVCAQKPNVKYLVMIDNDQIVDALHPIQLALWDLPVVSGVVCSPSEHGILKACFTMNDETTGKARFPTVMYTQRLPARGLREVNSCGAGLLCVRKEVFEKIVASGEIPFYIPEESRKECWDAGVMKIGEDIAFCRQAKAQGFPLHVDFAVRAIHMKLSAFFWPQELIDQNMDARDFKVDARDYAHE